MTIATDSGSSAWMAWVVTGLVACALYADVRQDIRRVISARNVVLAGLVLWYLLEAIQQKAAAMQFGPGAYEYGVLLVLLAGASFLIGYHRFQPRWCGGIERAVSPLDTGTVRDQVLKVGVVLGAIPIVLYAGADPLRAIQDVASVRRYWGGELGRGALGDEKAAILMLETFLFGVAWVATLVLADRHRTRGMAVLAVAVFAWYLFRSYGTGSRSVLFMALLAPVAVLYLRADEYRQRLAMMLVPFVAVGVYWIAGAMVEGRNEGRLAFEKTPEYYGNEMFRELLFIVDQIPKRDYLYGWTYVVELLNPIPRFLWEGKPLGFGIEFAAWHGYDALKGGPNMSPGVIGEMYVNFGLPGIVFLGVLAGAACRAWDQLGPGHARSLAVQVFYFLGLGIILTSFRSFSLSSWYPLIASLICVAIVRRRMQGATASEVAHPPDYRYAA